MSAELEPWTLRRALRDAPPAVGVVAALVAQLAAVGFATLPAGGVPIAAVVSALIAVGIAVWRPAATLAVLASTFALAPVLVHLSEFTRYALPDSSFSPVDAAWSSLLGLALAVALEPLFRRLVTPAPAVSTAEPAAETIASEPQSAPPLLVDTSALIDGRLVALAETGLLSGPIVVPRAVLWELQRLRDSRVSQRRARGDRGLDQVARLREMTATRVRIEDLPVAGDAAEASAEGDGAPDSPTPVDRQLLALCRARGARLLTTDTPLCRLAEIEGVVAINLHAVASALALRAVPGAQLELALTGPGEQPGQAVGHLPDGTRVIVRQGADRIGETVEVRVADLRKTRRGTLLFAELVPAASTETASAEESGNRAPNGGADAPG